MITIRDLESLPDLGRAVELQKQIWGFADLELLPKRLFVVATKVGGQVMGAFAGEEMVAFLLAIPGLKPGGKYYLHSHMMGVLPEYRNTGIGRRLKLRQRESAIARGIPLVEWTFDPLELKNAFFNIERLGAVIRRYVLNQYGTTTSPLHGGLPTDRCVPEWHLEHPRVVQLLEQGSLPEYREARRIAYPNEIASIRQTEPARAREIQAHNSEAFQQAFREGLSVVRFLRGETESAYILAESF